SNFTLVDARGYAFEVDHQIPRSKGGSDHIDNLVACCQKCNAFKGSLTVSEFKEKIKRCLSEIMWRYKWIEIDTPIGSFELGAIAKNIASGEAKFFGEQCQQP